jgi:starch phosphorylase
MATLVRYADDRSLQEELAAVRRQNKMALASLVQQRVGVKVDPSAMFDVQIKRIHEYKRQLLNILETVALYAEMRAHPTRDWTPRVKIFAGKAAASYHQAKLIIKLINDVARMVNSDATVRGRLKVVFLPNYNVSLAESIIPASDLSEQISTAGMEASGTGNMKLALNGALTIGTLDGANIEILEHVGPDNIFIFGMTTDQVEARRRRGLDMTDTIAASPALGQALDEIAAGYFSPEDPNRYRGLVDAVRHHDHFMVAADFDAFAAKQAEVAQRWQDKASWWRSSILNIAQMSWFSSDRAVREYAEEIWKVPLEA